MVLHSGRLKQVDEYVAIVLDKLSGIRGDLVRHDKNGKSVTLSNYAKPYEYGHGEILLSMVLQAKRNHSAEERKCSTEDIWNRNHEHVFTAITRPTGQTIAKR